MSLYPELGDYSDKGHRRNGAVKGTVVDDDSEVGTGKTFGQKCLSCLKANIFLIFLLLGICVGIGLGIGIRVNYPWFTDDARRKMYLAFPGYLFLNLLKMIIIPLVMTSLIAGMASLPSKAAGRLGAYTVLYYMITTVMAVLLGILLVATIKPGQRSGQRDYTPKERAVYPADSGLDLIRNLFPPNLFDATLNRLVTKYEVLNDTDPHNIEYDYDHPMVSTESGSNILGLVVFSCVFGIIVGTMGKRGEAVLHLMVSLQDCIIRLVQLIIWLAPIGICFILAHKIVDMPDAVERFKMLGWYAMTVLLGLFIHAFIVLPIIYFIFTRRNPYKLLLDVSFALLTALGTASSAATMPITMNELETKAKFDPRVIHFVIPVGATINMDGTALYEAVAAIFIAQLENHPLDAASYVIISITATLAAIGAAGVPEAGLVTMMIVLTAIGLPTDTVGYILTIDWFLDRCRTSVNVWGDSVGSGLVHSLSRKYLTNLDHREEVERGVTNGSFEPYIAYADEDGQRDTKL